MTAYFVEVLSRTGDIETRQKFLDLPVRIGRAYDNDFILDDEHTAAHHAVLDLDEEGNLCLKDLASRNGIICNGKREPYLRLSGDTVLRLGQTSLRIRSSDYVVAAEIFDSNNYNWEGWPPCFAGLALIVLLAASSSWISDTEQFNGLRYLMAFAPLIFSSLIWSGVWAFASRLFGGHAHFGRHVFIAASGLLVAQIWAVLGSLFAYAFSWEFLSRYDSHIYVAIACATLYFHLCTIKPRHPKRMLSVAMLMYCVGSALVLMINFQRSGRLSDELYMSDLYFPALRMSKDASIDGFFKAAESLKPEVDLHRHQISHPSDIENETD